MATATQAATPSKECPRCRAVLEPPVESCWKCGENVHSDIRTEPCDDRRPFKLYLDRSADLGRRVYEQLIQAFSEVDPRERPWCGIGVVADLLAVTPRGVTVAVIEELSGVEKGVVHVSQNWREPWQVETGDRAKHPMQSNPCDEAERAITAVKSSLKSFLKGDEQAVFPCMKCFIAFPDGYAFEGPKDFSMLDRDGVITLSLRNCRDLPDAILRPTEGEELDSRQYRKWIEELLKSKDDSTLGTWLDPAFDKPEPEPPKRQFWRFSYPVSRKPPAKEEELPSSNPPQTSSVQAKLKGSQFKFALTVISAILVGMVGWGMQSVEERTAQSPALESPPPEVTQTASTQDIPLSTAGEKEEILPPAQSIEPPQPVQPRESQAPVARKKDPPIKSTIKPEVSRTQAPGDPELRRQKVELQIRNAILRRAVTGVSVYFDGNMAYLRGQVETENQKSAAEKAAGNVPGVKEIYNTINVDSSSAAGG
jgi:hypothetical protein